MIEPDDDYHHTGDRRSLIKYVMWYLVRCRDPKISYTTIPQYIAHVERYGVLDDD